MARSMLSLGMLALRDLSSDMRRRGFMSGSAPPIFAAMEISFASLAKILPRLASIAPLKCLTFAHLLWPAINQFNSISNFHPFFNPAGPDRERWRRREA